MSARADGAGTFEDRQETYFMSREVFAAVIRGAHGFVAEAESKFAEAINQGEWAAISFALRTLGKERGFVERREVETSGRDGGPIQIEGLSDDERITEIITILDEARARQAKEPSDA